jgi:5'/3'-nucleotidase SurE
MHILVTNDDGYFSPGLASLVVAMKNFGTVSVVAPQVDMSGSGSSITLDRPLRVGKAESGFFFCEWYSGRLCSFSSNISFKNQARHCGFRN